MVVGFRASTKYVYDALMESKYVSTYTQAPALIDPRVGGAFSLFGGSIVGEFVDVVPNSRIVSRWRFSDWSNEPTIHYSLVTITLDSVASDTTRLTLNQTGVPLTDRYGNHSVPEKVKQGWQNFFWDRIHRVMGFTKVDLSAGDDD